MRSSKIIKIIFFIVLVALIGIIGFVLHKEDIIHIPPSILKKISFDNISLNSEKIISSISETTPALDINLPGNQTSEKVLRSKRPLPFIYKAENSTEITINAPRDCLKLETNKDRTICAENFR